MLSNRARQLSFGLIAIAALAVPSTSLARLTNPKTVYWIKANEDGSAEVYLNNFSACPNGLKTKQKNVIDLVTAAFLSGRETNIDYNATTCEILFATLE